MRTKERSCGHTLLKWLSASQKESPPQELTVLASWSRISILEYSGKINLPVYGVLLQQQEPTNTHLYFLHFDYSCLVTFPSSHMCKLCFSPNFRTLSFFLVKFCPVRSVQFRSKQSVLFYSKWSCTRLSHAATTHCACFPPAQLLVSFHSLGLSVLLFGLCAQ